MTTAERKAIRLALKANGFKREFYTTDLSGAGVYEEIWRKGADEIIIRWGEKKNG